MAKTVLVLIVLVMFSIGLFIVSKVGVFLKESKKEASDEREGVQLVKILEGIPGERTKVNMNIQDSAWTKRQKNHHPIYGDRSGFSETSFHRYQYCYSVYSWRAGHIYCNGWLSLRSGGIVFKCCSFLFFSYGATNVLSNICSWLSGDIFNNVDIFSAYRNSCCQIKRSCPVI